MERLRYTVEIASRVKKVLSVDLLGTGDLILALKPAEWARHADSLQTLAAIETDQSSVHVSPRSSEGNLITRTSELERAPERRMVQFTRAIKTTDRWAPVIFRLFADMTDDWEDSDDASDVGLGCLDPASETLLMGVFVGRSGRRFQIGRDSFLYGGTVVTEHEIGGFKLVVMTKRISEPSLAQGGTAFLPSTRRENLTEEADIRENQWVMEGFTDYGAYELFFTMEARLRGERFVFLQGEGEGW